MKLNISDESPIIFSPRYLLDSVYNIDIILESLEEIKKSYPNVLLLQMVKEDQLGSPKSQEVLELIDRNKLKPNVKLVPVVNNGDMPKLYHVSDICVSVPSSDGFPVTILEASACGTPFVVSRPALCERVHQKSRKWNYRTDPRSPCTSQMPSWIWLKIRRKESNSFR